MSAPGKWWPSRSNYHVIFGFNRHAFVELGETHKRVVQPKQRGRLQRKRQRCHAERLKDECWLVSVWMVRLKSEDKDVC
jgi:hypothetical protein